MKQNMTHPAIKRTEKYGSPTGKDIPEAEFQCDSCGVLHTKLYECDFCNRDICIVCYIGAAEETEGGLNVKDTSWNCCYECAEKKDVQVKILEEATSFAFNQVQHTGFAGDLAIYMNLRRALHRLEYAEHYIDWSDYEKLIREKYTSK